LNSEIRLAALGRWNSLTKPPGSLGRLEDAVVRLAMQQGTASPSLGRKTMYIFCGDHGVTAEGVSAYPSEVTRQMMLNFVAGGAAISVLCRQTNMQPVIVDAGVKGPPVEGVRNLRIGEGTANFAVTPAMTREQAGQAIDAGRRLASEETEDIRGVGEMGIGNTTSASALLCAFTGIAPEEATGPGTGLAPEGVRRKSEVIARALALHRPDANDPVGVLASVGGFEIAMMAGFLIGSAAQRVPVMMDGFITCAAALVARAIDPAVMDNLHFSHCSAEPAHARMLESLDAKPLFDLAMRLGEGSGAALGISLLDHALALYHGMATFEQAAVSGPDGKAD
jgi:nicotinate-nucleotide--dimethylbenzimidazole phosphoribosyltransferase